MSNSSLAEIRAELFRSKCAVLAKTCATEEPARSLDNQIWRVIGESHGRDSQDAMRAGLPLKPTVMSCGQTMYLAMNLYPDDHEGIGHSWNVPRLTTSLDAVIALIDVENPFVYTILTDFAGLIRARVTDSQSVFATSDGKTPALALMGAYLMALSRPRIDSGGIMW